MNDEGIIKISRRETGAQWDPVQGTELTNLVSSNISLSDTEKESLVTETMAIMRSCADPKTPADHNTGLIIGYVQSGKTLSFTGLSALARDNGYQIVVLLAGTTNNLVEQSYNRLRADLGVDTNRNWQLFTTKENGFQEAQVDRVKSQIAKWRRGNSRARTVVIVTMKQHDHLRNLANLFSEVDMSNVPTLIIDDEGDQAGMNTKALQEQESTTYARIAALREQFPHHSYLLYTATPQAPLLISRIDALSPDFGAVLTPGEHYVGGKEFFIEGNEKYIELIPTADVPDRDDRPANPPESFLDALRDFFVGVAIGLQEGDDQNGKNRSMMIHPAIAKDDHLMFVRWSRQLKGDWSVILDDENHSEYADLAAQFQDTFEGLKKTHRTNANFDDILPFLCDAISDTAIEELNTRSQSRIPTVDWKGEYSWILIGGIGLDRGFTVEGLTVSYMPRSIGVGNVDNIQQRARFFGYKKSYLGLCRIYLTSENIDAFEDYVTHEESVRGSISAHMSAGGRLKDWRREWYLSQGYNATRRSVILLDMYQSKGREGWVVPDYPYDDTELVGENRGVVEQLLASFPFAEYSQDGWNEQQVVPAFSDSIPIREVIPYIGRIRYKHPSDGIQHSAVMLSLEKLVGDDPDIECSVFAFSGPWSNVAGKRGLDEKSPPKIKNLFQGSNARTNYPGARKVRSDGQISFQIHRYDLETANGRLLKDVPVLAVHIPEHLSERVWVEHESDAIR